MSLNSPQHTDGYSATLGPLVQCLNLSGSGDTPATTYQRYDYLSDTLTTEGADQDHQDGDLTHLGGFTAAGKKAGSISVKVGRVTAKFPLPGHIVEFDDGTGSEFFVCTAPGSARTRNNVKTAGLNLKGLVHPFPLECLSEAYGSRALKTQAAGALAGSFTTALTAKNTRTGATVAWSLAAEPGETVPAWLSINASTGALSGTAVAGTYNLRIIITDTLAGFDTRQGFGRLSLTIT